MALNHEHDFIDAEDEVEARREARRITLIGAFVASYLAWALCRFFSMERYLWMKRS